MIAKENVLISSLTTMKIGGVARYVLEVEKVEEIAYAYNFARERNLPTFVLGGGANTIGRDEGFNGVIILNRIRGINIDGAVIHAMGGEIWDNVVQFACERNFSGIEALSKIPGTAGAAPVQNIGAYGQDISQVFESAEVFDTTDCQFKALTKDRMSFGYRKSILNTTMRGRFFVVAVNLRLKYGEMQRPFYKSIENYIATTGETDFSPMSIRNIVSTIRASKLPDPEVEASAGSFFKNVYLNDAEAAEAEAKGIPVYRGADGNKINSGWLIEKAGFAGHEYYGMQVSNKAALVLINKSAKGYADLAAAREKIVQRVEKMFGYHLEQEPVEII